MDGMQRENVLRQKAGPRPGAFGWQKAFLLWVGCALAALALGYAALHWVLPFLAPFLIALGLAYLLRRPVRFLARTAGIDRRPAAGLLLCLFAAAALGSLGYLTVRLLTLAALALGKLPAFFSEQCAPLLQAATARLGGEGALWDSETLAAGIGQALQQLAAWGAAALARAVAALPGMLVPFIFTCVATVYFTLDYDRLLAVAARLLGTARWQRLRRLKTQAADVLLRLLRAYFLLFALTYLQLAAGLALLRVEGAAALALLVAVVDILPVLGVGTVLLPWAALAALGGQGKLALGLLGLYAVIWLVRQLCEPRLVGRQLGLHPLVTLVALYAGLALFGLAGAILLPVAATLAWQLGRPRLQAVLSDDREPREKQKESGQGAKPGESGQKSP